MRIPSKPGSIVRDRWWVAPLILSAMGLGGCIYHDWDRDHDRDWGRHAGYREEGRHDREHHDWDRDRDRDRF